MDDSCHAFVSMFDEPSRGALADLRVAVKDNIAVAGRAFSAGLPAFADRVAPADAVAIATIRRAGGHFVGMTRTDSGGFGVMTPEVRNPVFPGCAVGGSSGGAAAAVAAGLADLGVGTDTGGSTRIPAACCGVYGFKPTHGVVPDDGVWPLAPRFDTVGFLAREPEVFARVMALFGVVSAVAGPAALRVGYDPSRIAQSDPAVEAALNDAVARLAAAGLSVTPVALPDRDATIHAHATVTLAQARDIYRGADAGDTSRFTETATRALRAAEGLTGAAIVEAEAQLAAIAAGTDAIFRGVDVVIGPTLPVSPPEAGRYRVTVRSRTMPVFEALTGETSLANITGSPALSAPLPDHRGVNLHIQARRGEDARLLAIAGPLMRLLGAVPR